MMLHASLFALCSSESSLHYVNEPQIIGQQVESLPNSSPDRKLSPNPVWNPGARIVHRRWERLHHPM